MKRLVLVICLSATALTPSAAAAQSRPVVVAAPTDVKPGSITCEDVPYPYPVSYLPLTLYGQDVRIAFMDVAPLGQPNGHTVVLFHGNNFAGFYFGPAIDALRKEGFRVIVPDQIGYGRSSKPIIPYNFHDMARNTRADPAEPEDRQGDDRRPLDGRDAGGALRHAVPGVTERLVLYNPIGLIDPRFDRPWDSADEGYKRTLGVDLSRPFAPASCATSRTTRRRGRRSSRPTRASATRGRSSADWPRLAMVQTLINQVQYLDPVVDDWAHIKAPTLVFGGAEDMLPGSAALFKERMKFIADTIPNGNARLLLLPGLGHVPHMEAPERTFPPLVAFLKEGLANR